MEKNEEYLIEGLPVEVSPRGETGILDVYNGKIITFDAATITLTLPQRDGLFMPSGGKGGELRLRFPVRDAIYLATCEIVRVQKVPPSLIITKPAKTTRIQRRNFVRVDAKVPVTLFVEHKDGKQTVIKSETLDLSGGGLLVYIPEHLALGTLLDIEIGIPSGSTKPIRVRALCQVCRSRKMKNDEYQIGLSFIEISEIERDDIIKYLFKRMRELRQTRIYEE